MPELINNFIRGKMNKDLDERLVPNGEYRDALNLEVATSEGSDVGTLQSILGNERRVNRLYDPITQLHQTWASYTPDGSKYIPSTAVAIGCIKDPAKERIYWFITDDAVDAVVQYDQITDTLYPILVDIKDPEDIRVGILKFKKDKLITGANIIGSEPDSDGFLFFTDNNSEPKKIEIEKFRKGTVDFATHTQVFGRNFILQDVTVIKKSPLIAPTIYKKRTVRDGEITTTTSAEFSTVDTTTPDVDPTEPIVQDFGTVDTYSWSNAVNYIAGDFLLLTIQDPDDRFSREFQVRLKVLEVFSEYSASCELQTAGSDIPTGIQGWEVELELDDPLFEFKFPRFATRYKYDDNQFSVFSPFTDIAFIPGYDFEYNGEDGYNLAMTNNVRVLEIRDFVTADVPPDVVAIDILYKDTASTNVYRVDTIERDSAQWNDNSYGSTVNATGRIKIETELISSLLPSNQLLRPYDNVPRKALAQEITANRLIYANYTQNFNMVDYAGDEVIPAFDFSIVHDPTKNEYIDPTTGENLTSDPIAGVPIESLKTARTYQMGVVYMDEFGRQTPVFTNDSGGRSLAKEFANLYNTINVNLTNNPPNWATHYKYYIKETSNEYYNLALDRFYLPEDGSVWLSFSSADRNKVDEETFLELKKQHDDPTFIPDPARYKILAISNEAPDSIRETYTLKGSGSSDFTPSGFPLKDRGFVELTTESFENLFGEDGANVIGKPDLWMQIAGGSNLSEKFQITGIQKQAAIYRIQLKEPMNVSVAFTTNGEPYEYSNRASDTFTINIYQVEYKRKPEFDGRFFVKIYKDAVLEQNILKGQEDGQLFVEYAKDVAHINRSGKSSYWRDSEPRKVKGWFFDNVAPLDVRRRAGSDVKYQSGNPGPFTRGGIGIQTGRKTLNISFHGFGNPWQNTKAFYEKLHVWWNWPSNDPDRIDNVGFAKQLDTAGTQFRFTDDPNKENSAHIYTISRTYRSAYCVDDRRTGRHGSGKYGSQRVVRWNITLDKEIAFIPPDIETPTGNANPLRSGVEFLKLYMLGGDTYSSEDPAIFETYPKEAVDMDLYYAASNVYEIENAGTPIASHGNSIKKLSWFNCYSFGQGVESNRIRDDFNQPVIDKNPVVSTVLDEAYGEESKATGLIFSGIFNSTSGINRLNQFIQAEAITKDLNPAYTSIQKLYARDTNLITLCEDKCLQILANKDALFNADGSTNITSNKAVLGQALPYAGEYGISQNPESFAAYGNRAYFTDKNRGVVLRLAGGLGGGQGLTEISAANMRDFFNDNLHTSTKLLGTYDDDKDVYYLTLDKLKPEWQTKLKLNDSSVYSVMQEGTTIAFKEDVKGWTSRKDFIPETGISLNNKFYSLKNGQIWEHGSENTDRNNFYGVQYDSAIRFIFNQQPASIKRFKTLNYSGSEARQYLYTVEGQSASYKYNIAEVKAKNYTPISEIPTRGWYNSFMFTNLQEGNIKEFLNKEGKYFNYIKGIGTEFVTNTDNNLDSKEFSMQGIGRATVSGDAQEVYNLQWFVDASCYTPFQAPIASGTTLTVIEDCNPCTSIDLNNFVSDANIPAETLTFTLVNDNTSNGTLSFDETTGIVSFSPVANFNGSGGAFTYTASNSQLTSNVATIDVDVSSVNDGPVWVTDPNTVPNVNPGDTWSFTVQATDVDQDALTITSADLPSWATLTDNGDGTALITGTIPSGNYTFTVNVSDGELDADLVINTSALSQILQTLRFVGRYVASSVPAQTIIDPDGTSISVCPSPASTVGNHGCNRGSFKVLANGTPIGIVNISNSGGAAAAGKAQYYQGSLANSASNPDYPHAVMTDIGQPSGTEEYYYDSSTYNNSPNTTDRYEVFQIDAATAESIAQASGNGDISFTLECNTFTGPSTQSINCHESALWFSIFRPGYGQYLCTAFSTSSLVTINAYTGNIINPIP